MPRRTSGRFNRRNFVHASGITGLAAVTAGCLGDDGDDAPADDADDADTDDASVDDGDDGDDAPPDDADDADDTPEAALPEIHDATFHYTHGDYEHPADLGFNPYGTEWPFPYMLQDSQPRMITRSNTDLQYYGRLVADWNYQPGLLEFTMEDDFYWWNGEQLTIDDIIAEFRFQDYHWGGDDLDAYENIVAYEKVGDQTARLSLPDTWHEEWAISQTLDGYQPEASRFFHEPWIEEFEDASGLDAVQDIREEIGMENHRTDEELVDNFYWHFEFRFDDAGHGEVGEDYLELELVPEKNGNVRHMVNLENSTRPPNYRYIRAHTVEEPDVWETEMFDRGDLPWLGYDEELEDEFDFPIQTIEVGPGGGTGLTFNNSVHPSDNVHFRRAWAYFVDRTQWETPGNVAPEHLHGYSTDVELYEFVSEDVIEALTDYGHDEHRWDDAETEMETGGFERNGDGDWILQEDSPAGDAGEPMDFTIETWEWSYAFEDEATDFWTDLEDWGISTEILLDTGAAWGESPDFVVTSQYTGGDTIEGTFESVFVQASGNREDTRIADVVLAPEVGDTTVAGDTTDGWREYETAAMSQRLAVTTEAAQYQALVDQLTWVNNQIAPHFTTHVGMGWHIVNDYHWEWMDPEEHPEKFWDSPLRLPDNGAFQWVPEDER